MEAAQTTAREARPPRSQDSERRCLVTGEMLPKDQLIRFVLDPDHVVVPDLAQNLPGRGLWVTAARCSLEIAVAKNLFAKAAKDKAIVSPLLPDQVAHLLRKRCLDYIGLACGAGIAILGQPQVEDALKKGKLGFLMLAQDASVKLTNPHQIPTYQGFSRTELGAALGYAQSVYVGLKAHTLTEKLKIGIARLEKIVGDAHISQGNG